MRRVYILGFPDANLLDIAGPAQVLASASQYAMKLGVCEAQSYDVLTIAFDGKIATSTGLSLDAAPAEIRDIDTFIISGGYGVDAARQNDDLIAFVRAQAARAERTVSICTGAFILAQTGLLDGRRATTHWGYCDALAKEFPSIDVDPDAAFVEDGPFWTSAGVLAGVDLALALVERDLGRRMANYTARALVAVTRRGAGEAQITPHLQAREAESGRIAALMEWITDNPQADLSTAALAAHASLSVRSLHRHFAAACGQSPAVFVEAARVQTAKRLLASTDHPLKRIAMLAGFSSMTTMQRAFLRADAVTPAQYRKRLSPQR